jgi:hypothetical protein
MRAAFNLQRPGRVPGESRVRVVPAVPTVFAPPAVPAVPPVLAKGRVERRNGKRAPALSAHGQLVLKVAPTRDARDRRTRTR